MPNAMEVDLIGQMVVTSGGDVRKRTVAVSDQVVTEAGFERITLATNTLNQEVAFVGIGVAVTRMALMIETDKKIRVKFVDNGASNRGVIIPANSFVLCEVTSTSHIYLSNESTNALDTATVDFVLYKF